MNISLDIIQNISDFLNSGFMDILKNFLAIIPKILYFIIACIMSLIDLFQVLFRKLAGLDPIIISGETTTGDSIYKIIMDALFTGKYPAINTAFWSLVILGVFMLLVTCIIATIRLEYNPDKEKGNSKGAIVKNFFKALFSFAIVPIACIFGMALANSLVGIIDQVTLVEVEQTDNVYTYFDQWTGISGTDESNILMKNKASYIAYDIFGITVPTTSEPFSGMIFKASAYSCNRFRLHGSDYLAEINASSTDLGIFSSGQVGDYRTAADIVDTGFAINAKLKGGAYSLDTDKENFDRDHYRQSLALFGSDENITNFSKYNVELVWYFYDLWTFNYIIGFAAVIIIGKLYFQFCLVLMARLFEIAGLFLVAPIPIAIMPMDGGGAMGRWRGTFIGKFALVIIMVFGINIVSPVLSIIQGIQLFGLPLLDNIVLAMFIVAALNAINSLNNTFSTIIFDKASQYKDSMEAAKDATSSIQGGLNATLAAGRVATTLPLAAAHAGVKVGGAVLRGAPHLGYNMVRGGRQMINRSRERREIRNATRFDQQAASTNYQGMKAKERKAAAEDFLKTKAGQSYIQEYKNNNPGLKTSDAKGALIDDERNIKHRDGTIDNHQYITEEQREEFQRFMHDKELFDKSNEAKKYAAGSKDYYDALDKYRELSKRQQTAMFEGNSVPLSKKQQDIQAKRAAADSMKAYKDTKFGKWSAGAGGWTKGVAKKVGKFNNDHIKPFVDRAAGGLQEVINTIPGIELFPRKKK